MEKIHSKTRVTIRIIVTTLLVFALIPFGAIPAFAAGTNNGDGSWSVTETITFPETIGSAVFTADGGETVTITSATGYDSDDVETTSLSFGGNAVNNSFGDGTEYAVISMTVSGVTGQFIVTATGDGSSLGSWTYGEDPPEEPVFVFSANKTNVVLSPQTMSDVVTVVSTETASDDVADPSWSIDGAASLPSWLNASADSELTLSVVGTPTDNQSTTVILIQDVSGKQIAIEVEYVAPVVEEPVFVFSADKTKVVLSPPIVSAVVTVASTETALDDVADPGWSIGGAENLPGWLSAIADGGLTLSVVGTPTENQSTTVTLVQDVSGQQIAIEVEYVAPVVEEPTPITYEVLEHFGKWTLGTKGQTASRIAANRDSFLRLTLNGALLEADGNYTVAGDDETVITLANGLLNNLLVGEHQLVAWYSDGYSEVINLTVKAAPAPVPDAAETNLPQTGDGNVVGLATAAMLAIIAGFALVVTSQKRRRHNF